MRVRFCEQRSTAKVPMPRCGIDHATAPGMRQSSTAPSRSARPKLAQHAMNVVLDCLFREIQLRGDFFVGESAANHLNKLLFPAREAEIVSDHKAGRLGVLILIRHALEQCHAETGRTNGFMIGHGTNRRRDFHGGSVLQHETHNPIPHGAQKISWVCLHADHDHFEARDRCAYF